MGKLLRNRVGAIVNSKGIGRTSPMEKVRKFFADSKMAIGALKERAKRAVATRRVR